jgi:hypothetical protein
VTTLSKFEEEIETKLGRRTTMGTREYLLEKAKNEGVMLGVKKAEKLLAEERKKVLETKYEVVSNLILANRFTTEEIAEYAGVAENFVQKVRADLAKKKKN